MKLKVEGNPGLVRDSRSKAIILEDQESYKVYLNEKRFREKVAQTSNNVETEISQLKEEINEIKSLLHKLVDMNINK